MQKMKSVIRSVARAICFAPMSVCLAIGKGYSNLLGAIFPGLAETWQRKFRFKEHTWIQAQYYREMQVVLHGDFNSSEQSRLLKDSLVRAFSGDSKLPENVRAINGMSGQKYR